MSGMSPLGSIKLSDFASLRPFENELETEEAAVVPGSLKVPGSLEAPARLEIPENVATPLSNEDLLEKQLEYLEKLQLEEESFKDALPPPVEEQVQIDPSKLNIPINPIFDDEFDGIAPLINIGKQVFGPSALQFRALGPSMGILGAFLGMANRNLVPGLVGLGMTTASTFFLSTEIKELFTGPSHQKSGVAWLAGKTMTAAKAGLAAYSLLSGLGMLQSTYGLTGAVGLLTTATSIGGGLYSLYTADSENAQTSGMMKTAQSIAKTGAVAYGTIAGLGATLGLGSLPGLATLAGALGAATSYAGFGTTLFTGMTNLIAQKPVELALTLGLTLGTQLLMWKVTGSAFQNMHAELEKITNSNKYGPTLERLQGLGQEEYRELISKETGMDFEKIQDAFEPLRSRNPNYPENAAKPVIARLMLLNQEVTGEGGAMQKYSELQHSNSLKEADEFMNKELRPKLMTIVYLKHCVVSPTRPQFGNIMGEIGSQEYYSYVSHLVGTPVKFPLNEVDPVKVQEEAHVILMKENELQQQSYFYKEMQAQALLKEKAEQFENVEVEANA